jgi:hypothetical protein
LSRRLGGQSEVWPVAFQQRGLFWQSFPQTVLGELILQSCLAPVFIAFAIYGCGLILCYPYLCQPLSLDAAQQELIKVVKAA